MKSGKGVAGAYYEMLRPISKNDLDRVDPDIAAVLKGLPPRGYVSVERLKGHGHDARLLALKWACANGIMRKTAHNSTVMNLQSVRFWLTQFNSQKMKNLRLENGTKRTYANALEAFNRWLSGREFPVRKDRGRDDKRTVSHEKFPDVEHLLRFCEHPDYGTTMAKRVMSEYLADLATSKYSLSTAMVHCTAVKSYFTTHDIQVDVRVNRNLHAVHDVQESHEMSLFDLYKMMTAGSMDVMLKAIIMIKFQAGLDSSTFADRFNFEGYDQIVKHFGMEDYDGWDLGRCPVPIRLVRVKTGMAYTTFIDRDAVMYLQDYLRWREFHSGSSSRSNDSYSSNDGMKRDMSGPLFVTRRGVPVSPGWISNKFSKAAANAGIQKRTSHRVYKIHAHEVRDLLKSTLIVSGCAQYVTDHVLGHATNDSYEKQIMLYPETLRSEYAKASRLLNIFTNIKRHLSMTDTDLKKWQEEMERKKKKENIAKGDRYRRIEAQQQEMQVTLQKMTSAVTDILRIMALNKKENSDTMSKDILLRFRELEGDGKEEYDT